MRRRLARIAVAALVAGAAPAPARAEEVVLRWLGQACFHVTTPDGVRVLMDPVAAGLGFDPLAPMPADVVTISHDHPDHANLALAKGAFSVLRGVAPGGRDWNHVDFEIGDLRVTSVASYHDKEKGALRGLNAIFVLELPNFKLVHLGDLGHPLDDSQIQPLKGADVLLVPVGGFFTLDPAEMDRVVEQLQPKAVVIPMHFKTATSRVKELAPPDAFLKGKNVVRAAGNEYRYNLAPGPRTRAYVVLTPK